MNYRKAFTETETEEEGYALLSGIILGLVDREDADEHTKMMHINLCAYAFKERFPMDFYKQQE